MHFIYHFIILLQQSIITTLIILSFHILIWLRGFDLNENSWFTWLANIFTSFLFSNIRNDHQSTHLKLLALHMISLPEMLFQFPRMRATMNDRREKWALLNKSWIFQWRQKIVWKYCIVIRGLTHFRPMLNLCRNQVAGFY